MGSQFFYVGTFPFGIHLQRSLAVFKYSKFELSGLQNNEQPTKGVCLTEKFGENFVKLHQVSFLKNFSKFERKRISRFFQEFSQV